MNSHLNVFITIKVFALSIGTLAKAGAEGTHLLGGQQWSESTYQLDPDYWQPEFPHPNYEAEIATRVGLDEVSNIVDLKDPRLPYHFTGNNCLVKNLDTSQTRFGRYLQTVKHDTLLVKATNSKCFIIFNGRDCTGRHIKFDNVTSIKFKLNKSGKGQDAERLLNYNVFPTSFQSCSDAVKSNKIKEGCKKNITISIESSEVKSSIHRGISKEVCVNMKEYTNPETNPRRPRTEVKVSIIRRNIDSTCLELFPVPDCKDQSAQLFVPVDDHEEKIWEYFSDTRGNKNVDMDIQSLRKCTNCPFDQPPSPPPQYTAGTEALPPPSASASQSAPPLEPKDHKPSGKVASDGPMEKIDNPCENTDLERCETVADFLRYNFHKPSRNSLCFMVFNTTFPSCSFCNGCPIVQDSSIDFIDKLKRISTKYEQLFNWSIMNCSSYDKAPSTCKIAATSSLTLEQLESDMENALNTSMEKGNGKSKQASEWNFTTVEIVVLSIASILVLIMLIVVLILSILLWQKRRRIQALRKNPRVLKRNKNQVDQVGRALNVHQIDAIEANDYENDIMRLQTLVRSFATQNYEIPRSSINIGNIRDSTAFILGVGEFSVAFKGRLEPDGRTVAVKTMKSGHATAKAMRSVLRECTIMMQMGKRDRIVEFIGVCTENVKNGEILTVLEYCEKGSLKSFLVQHRTNFANLINEDGEIPQNDENIIEELDHMICDAKDGKPLRFNTLQLFKWCSEVADGMEFLATRKIVHISLSSKNVLLDSNFGTKISDFHFAKLPGESSMNSNASYTLNSNRFNTNKERLIPWRWFAVESLMDDIFSTQSDVWTFGVFMWEVFTLGSTPYPEYCYGPEFTMCIKHGYRLPKPGFATIGSYELMLLCWYDAPEKRPTFTKLKSKLGKLLPTAKNNVEIASTSTSSSSTR